MVLVTIFACFSEIVPAACAAAAAGYTGGSGSPDNAVRGPRTEAARTRARASATSTCQSSTSNAAVPRVRYRAAVERHSSSVIIR